MTADLEATALAYARRGIAVVPVVGKKPHGQYAPHGLNSATTDPNVISSWFRPGAGQPTGIAIVPGDLGAIVIDIDQKLDGYESLSRLEGIFGKLPTTSIVATPGGGEHRWLSLPAGIVIRSFANAFGRGFPGIDVRSSGGYAVVPGSQHPNGGVYRWANGTVDERAMLPPHHVHLLTNPVRSALTQLPETIGEGTRHATLLSLAGRLRRDGAEEPAIEAALLAANDSCVPPMLSKDVHALARDVAARYESGVTSFSAPWPDRKRFESCAMPRELPEILLPGALRDFIVDESERMGVPLGFLAIPLIVALGSLLGSRIGVAPKQLDSWFEHANLWGAIVGDPSTMKSPALSAALRPLHVMEKAASEEFSRERAVFDEAAESARDEIVQLQAALRKTIDDKDARGLLEQGLRDAKARAGIRPRHRRHIVHDATVEALSLILNENPRGVLQESDELSRFIAMMDKKGHEGDRGFYLAAWSGKTPYSSDRITRGAVSFFRPCLSIAGAIQPDILRRLVAETESGGADGFIQRFQLLYVCSDKPPYRHVDRSARHEARKRVEGLFAGFAELDPSSFPNTSTDGVPLIGFDANAQRIFNDWRLFLENRLGDETPTMQAYLAKGRKTVPALALIFHLCDRVERGVGPPISESAIAMACNWFEILESHARWVYEPRCNRDALAIAKRIELGKMSDGETVRSLRDHIAGGSRERIDAALSILESAYWLRRAEPKPGPQGGRPSELILLHPDFSKLRPEQPTIELKSTPKVSLRETTGLSIAVSAGIR